jgi:hypothetical protein
MASRFSIETIFSAIDKFTAPLSKMTRSTKTFTQTLKADFASAQRTVAKWGDNIKRYAWVGVAALGAALGMAAKQGIELASNLLEVQNVVDTTFGDNAKQIDAWSKSAMTNFGLSELQAKDFTSTLGSMAKSSGLLPDQIALLSTSLAGLSGDYASFRNLKPEEAFEKMKSVITGETEPLRALGFNMTVANLQAFALTKGINKQWKEMSQAEQVMLRYNYIMANSKDAQGDFAKTLKESLANQLRVLKTNFAQKLAEAFQKLIPYLITLADKFNAWLNTIDTGKIADFIVTVFNGVLKVGKIFFAFLKILKPFAPLIIAIVAAFVAYRTVMMIASVAQMIFNAVLTANPIGIVIVAIGALVFAILWLIKNWDKVVAALKAAWNWIVKFFKDIINWIWKTEEGFTQFSAILSIITGPFGILVSMLMEVGRTWDEITEKFKSGDILGGILAIGGALLSGLLAPIQGFLELIGKIPGLDKIALGGAKKIEDLRMALTGKEKKETVISPISPTERAFTSYSKEEKTTTNKGEVTIVDKTGKATVTKKLAAGPYALNLQTSGGFIK